MQLRAENRDGTAYNLVGFQTNLTFAEQRRVFRLIPGLENAEFLRYGVMHRNTFVDAPRLLDADLALRARPARPPRRPAHRHRGLSRGGGIGLLAALEHVRRPRRAAAASCCLATTALGALIAYATDPATRPTTSRCT